MNDLEIWLIIALLALATLIDRSAFWVVGHHITLPKRVQEALRYAPSCALAAIIVPDLLMENNHIALNFHNPKLLASLMAGAFFLWKRDMLLIIIFGMGIFTLVRYFL